MGHSVAEPSQGEQTRFRDAATKVARGTTGPFAELVAYDTSGTLLCSTQYKFNSLATVGDGVALTNAEVCIFGQAESNDIWWNSDDDWSYWMACFDLSGKELWHYDFAKSSVSALEFDATGANVTAYGIYSWQTFSAATGLSITGGTNAVPSLVSGQTVPLGGYLVTSGVQSSTSSDWLSIHDRTGAKLWEATSVPTGAIPIGLAADGTLYVVSSGSLFIYETEVRAATR